MKKVFNIIDHIFMAIGLAGFIFFLIIGDNVYMWVSVFLYTTSLLSIKINNIEEELRKK